MKMTAFVILGLVGLALCALFLRRLPLRDRTETVQFIAVLPHGTARPGHSMMESEAHRRLMEILQREEERQRPWEGRN